MTIECMCVVCHGPIEQLGPGPRPIVCGENCYGIWRRHRDGSPLPWRYQDLRAMHAHRRELATALGFVTARLHAGGWLEVG